MGSISYVIRTELEGNASQVIATEVLDGNGTIVFRTSQDISSLKPIFQNSQAVFARIEAQHQSVMKELEQGRLVMDGDSETPSSAATDPESDALEHALELVDRREFEKATSALEAILQTYPNCSEARELLEVVTKASSDARLPVDVGFGLRRGVEAFTSGRKREAIDSWKQCLAEEPDNRRLQLLVLMAASGSQSRRRRYANDILAADSLLVREGRKEEAQALLLVAQSLDQGPETGTGTAPGGVGESWTTEESSSATVEMKRPPIPEPGESGDETIADHSMSLESLVPDASETEDIAGGTAPPPSSSREQEGAAAPEAEPAPPIRRPAVRPPMGRGRRSSPWPLIAGAGAGVLVASGLVAWWLLSSGATVPPQRLEAAASLMGAAQYDRAIAAYEDLLREYGEHAGVLLGRGRAKLASGDSEAGLNDLRRALELDPEASAIAEEIGDVMYSRGNYPEAIDYYQQAFAGGGGSAEGRYRFAVSLVQRDRADEAVEHLEAAIAKEPEHGEAQFLYGQLLNERGRHAEAESALRAAEAHVEAGGDYLHQLGIALLEQGNLDAAEETARKLLRSYPQDARARSLLGEVYLNREQYEPARAQLIAALRTDPREPRAQLALGQTWLAIGKARNDLQDLGKARQVLTNASGLHEGKRLLALAQVSLAQADLENAERLLEESLEQEAPPLEVHLTWAEAKVRGGDWVGAAEELQRASAFSEEDPALALSLAISYFELDEPARAAEYFLEAIQGIGLVSPPGGESGPVVLPTPYVPLPERFDINRAIRNAHRAVLAQNEEDPTAAELRTLTESASFVLGSS